VHLRNKLEISTRISTVLDEILNHQRAPYDRTGLGYSNRKGADNEEESTSSRQPREE
jgi:hypothetical protein